MLAYVLALAVGLGSFALYMAAFFFPEVHRKNDFIWSGVGLFYALVLWVYGSRITGGLLLGQGASVALLGWSISQTLQLRRKLTPITQQTDVPSTTAVTSTVKEQVSKSVPTVTSGIGGVFNGLKNQFQQLSKSTQSKTPVVTQPVSTPKPQVEAKVEVIDNRTPVPETTVVPETSTEVTPPVATETVETSAKVTPPVATETVETSAEVTPPVATETVEISTEVAPPLTEEEAVSQAVEAASSQVAESSSVVAIPPHPPDPKLVEAAIKDADQKHQPVSPPDPEVPENPSPS